ncbi:MULTISPECIES: VCBS repeat-containing protein, partial [Thalassotalea]
MKKHILSMLCMLMCAINVSATENMTWEDKQYHYLHGDFNGDKVPDLFLQSLSEQTPSLIVFGQIIDENTQYLVENEITLPDIVNGHLWNNLAANVVVFDHNGDGLSDIFIVNHSQKTALVINGDVNDIDFSNIANTYTKKELKWLKKSTQYVLYTGDFNGDKQQDLLAVSEKNKTHYLMHATVENSLFVAQEIKKAFKWAKKTDVDVKIADFNDDGKADVFAVARAKNTKHYLTFADENGLLGETTVIKEKVNNKDWNANDFSFIVTHADADETLDLVRLNNMPGGVDEYGELIEAEAGDDVDDITNDCDQLFYSIENLSEGESCAPWGDAIVDTTPGLVGTSKPSVETHSFATGGVTQMAAPIECSPLDPCGETTPPETPSSYPSVDGGSYHPVGSQIRVRYNSIHMANYYEIYTSTNNSSYSKVTTTPSLSAVVNVRSSYGYFYIKYKACNTTGGCSGFSPYRRLYVYTVSGKPQSLTSSSYSPSIGESFNLTIGFANGSVDGAKYYLQESFNGGSYTTVCTKTRTTWRENSYTCPISGKSNSGIYKYKAYVCNPQNVGCGGNTYSSNVVVAKPVPGSPSSFSASPSTIAYGGTTTLSWSKPSDYTGSVYYNVYTKKPGGNRWRWKTKLTSSSTSSGPLDLSGVHYFDVEACNSDDICGNSTPVVGVTVL